VLWEVVETANAANPLLKGFFGVGGGLTLDEVSGTSDSATSEFCGASEVSEVVWLSDLDEAAAVVLFKTKISTSYQVANDQKSLRTPWADTNGDLAEAKAPNPN
jgi:hypothetical protein